MRNLIACLLTLTLTGCFSNRPESIEDLTAEINGKIKDGMPLMQALDEFDKLDFICHEGTALDPNSKNTIECYRRRSGLLNSCLHRIWLDNVSPSGSVTNLKIYPPACAWL